MDLYAAFIPLSTTLLDIFSDCADVPYGTQDVVYMGDGLEPLSDFVRRIRQDRGWSLHEVEKRSARSGYRIGHTYINRIETGESTNPSPRKLKALAVGLDVLEEELFARVRGVARTRAEGLEEELLAKFRRLPPEWQPDLIGILDVLLRQHVIPAKEREIFREKRRRAERPARPAKRRAVA